MYKEEDLLRYYNRWKGQRIECIREEDLHLILRLGLYTRLPQEFMKVIGGCLGATYTEYTGVIDTTMTDTSHAIYYTEDEFYEKQVGYGLDYTGLGKELYKDFYTHYYSILRKESGINEETLEELQLKQVSVLLTELTVLDYYIGKSETDKFNREYIKVWDEEAYSKGLSYTEQELGLKNKEIQRRMDGERKRHEYQLRLKTM